MELVDKSVKSDLANKRIVYTLPLALSYLKNKDNLKMKMPPKMKITSKMKTTSKIKTNTKLKTSSKM